MAVPAVGRLEFTPSYRDLRLTAITARRVMDAYAGGEFPIAVRRGMLSGGSEKIWKRFARYDRFLHFKVRDFDSSINPWMVRVAINMLREQIFEGTEKTYDAYFDFVYEGLVNTKIFRDDGLFLRKHVGTAYGHPWNTLVQSTILLFLGYASVRLLHPEMPMSEFAECVWVEALEGDMLMGLKGRLAHCTVEEVAEVARRAFAVEWLSEESFSTNAFTDLVCGELRGVKFLDWRWYDGDDEEEIVLPYQHARDKFVQLLFPDDGVPCDKTKTYLRVLAHYLGAAGNRAMELWLQELMDWIGFDGDCPNWPLKMRPLLEPYFGLLSTVPAPLRMTFAQWRDLVTMEKKEYQAVWPNHFWHAMR
ncbi:hypothetical protein K470DRAFT_258387 [Piedraia hortae CBS 480.64]|uniref:RNA-directed RNA polymerase C-terminal domain-containing protein n=1 Tax=Piedraia hortae CBS 480.64 TaxID=1314780 RepID=A0A6A7BXR6_9PEZI|nr:hypothetical protein K470DRAFT_258387 [Piedraia hortae CBS 480.64]